VVLPALVDEIWKRHEQDSTAVRVPYPPRHLPLAVRLLRKLGAAQTGT
jgi:hypothetical protein